MSDTSDRRLIEDYLPIEAISAEASREKSVRKGHISTLHLWWARRPLVACRAAVYGALVPASRFVPENGPDNKKQSLGRANAARFVTDLCKYPGHPATIRKAQEHILEAHAQRLTAELVEARETGQWPGWVHEFQWPTDRALVTPADIEAGRAPRPRVLDMFAGGGAIPLEALRLGCEAYALDLNPVAHIIELCTLVYPQKYGRPDPAVRGMTGPKNEQGETTWGGLAEEVRYWGEWVLRKVKADIGDLYPPIPDPEAPPQRLDGKAFLPGLDPGDALTIPSGYLTPVAYLWTRTVTCRKPDCGATVPLVRQTWLCTKRGRYVAMRMAPDRTTKRVQFQVVEATSEAGLGFDPAAFSRGGNATCPFCGTVADSAYVKLEGQAKRMGQQLMAVVCTRSAKRGKVYLAADELGVAPIPPQDEIHRRITTLCARTGLTVPDEPIITDAKNSCWTHLYGLTTFGDLFTPRQMLCLLAFADAIRLAEDPLAELVSSDHARALLPCLAVVLDRLVDFGSTGCTWNHTGGRGVLHTMARQAIPMTWDFAETNPFNPQGASWVSGIEDVPAAFETAAGVSGIPARVYRGSATNLPFGDGEIDAVVTDPPYYDNVPYADISDFFYVWLRRTVGRLFPEHFAGEGTPKKSEAVADATRHQGDRSRATEAYERSMARSLHESYRVLKAGGQLVVVYAHKTTLGWSTLVGALRSAGFAVTEAWPVDTERGARLRAMDSAALASSIFLVARKRTEASTGAYEGQVRPELEQIVRERVAALWDMGVSGADLVIASVGAGLRAFTRHARVEYANGEEVPARRFLAEVETVVLETILARLSKEVGANGGGYSLAAVDPATRFYILWRYTYRWADLDAGEAIVFANGTHVELDGPGSLSYGAKALVEKKKGKYRLRDYQERGEDERLGLPDSRTAQAAPLIDALHRTLWLMKYRPRELPEFLHQSRVNREQMRLVAQALAGPALKGGQLGDLSPSEELTALQTLTANWRSVVEEAGLTSVERQARRAGQERLLPDEEEK